MRKYIEYITGFLLLLLLVQTTDTSAQKKRNKKQKPGKETRIYDVDTLIQPIPNNRASFHIYIDREQNKADAADGNRDGIIYYSDDTFTTNILTKAIIKNVDQLQIMIENMPANSPDKFEDNRLRILYLGMLQTLVKKYNFNRTQEPLYYRRLVANFKDMLIARHENKLKAFVHDNINIYTLENSQVLDGYPEERSYIFTEMGKKEPQMMIKRLGEFANEPFACSIILEAAKVVPSHVYNYATSTNTLLSGAVMRCNDPLVQTIVNIANNSKSPLKAMPFLSDIYTGRKTIKEIDIITSNQDLFYRNLVRLKLSAEKLGGDTYNDEIAYRAMKFVRTMNDLHESPDPVRFRCVDSMNAQELYFMMVYGQDEIYTSSFLGSFKRMMERMKPMRGDELFDTVHYDHFRTFIRMCAGYNTLDQFLATVDSVKKTKLMHDFVAGLEKGKDDDLEDAVDVADAFGSIRDSTLSAFLMKEVTANYERCAKAKNKKGLIVYGLLATLFKGNTAELNLPPINLVPYKSLVNDSNIVYEQFFFYGDEDGKNSYASFLGNFKDGKWKIITEKNWAVISSTTGNKVIIYANLPIPEPGDEEAQNQLCKFLADKNIHPTIIVHRGHSYHLPLTLEKLQKNTRIVVLGSCGGYHNLSIVLDHSPDANIVSSKQVGSMTINEPIIKAINDRLLAGDDINWIGMWDELNTYFTAKKGGFATTFSDYVPPHKNLGAIFIKAYRKMSNSINSEEDD